MSDREKIEIYTCSKCGKPNSCSPATCCRDGDYHGKKISKVIPKLSGRYFTEFFDSERPEWEIEKNGVGRIYRSAGLKSKIIGLIYQGNEHLITKLIESLEKIYTYYRENRPHSAECEFALEDDCVCWCNQEYHRLKGKGAEIRAVK